VINKEESMYCSYFQAKISKQDAWFFVAVLRSWEHLVLDRTIDKQESIFEFFVPSCLEDQFLDLMHYFEKEGIVSDLKKLSNRLADPSATV